jgi:hypothetical protein
LRQTRSPWRPARSSFPGGHHPGIAVTGSAGDFGDGVNYPASSQYVTAVGGTSLTKVTGGGGWSETVWGSGPLSQVPELGGGTGSGCYEPKPAWQHDTGGAGRTVADVAAVADPNTGVAVYDSYGGLGNGLDGLRWYERLVANHRQRLRPRRQHRRSRRSLPHALSTQGGSLFDGPSGTNASAPCSPAYLCTGKVGYDGPTDNGTPRGLGAF